MTNHNMITVISPYKVVAQGWSRLLSLHMKHCSTDIAVFSDACLCVPSDVFVMYFSHNTLLLLSLLTLLRSRYAVSKVVINLDEIVFDLIAVFSAIGINALLSKHNDILELENVLRLLLSHNAEHCPLYLSNKKMQNKLQQIKWG